MPPSPLSDEEVDRRVLAKPGYCPFCYSGDVDNINTDGDDTEVWLTVLCGACKGEYVEIYKLAGATNA